MLMNSSALKCVVLLILIAGSLSPHAIARDYAISEYVTVDIDAAGHVAAVEFPENMPSIVATALGREIDDWLFQPAVREGENVASRTYLDIDMTVNPLDDGGYVVELVRVDNGPKLVRLDARYPDRALRRRIQGAPAVRFKVNPDGTAGEIAAEESEADSLLVDAALAAVRKAQFVPEYVDGEAVTTTAILLVRFCLLPARGECDGATLPRGRLRASKHQEARMTALDSPVRLLTEAVGKRLIVGR